MADIDPAAFGTGFHGNGYKTRVKVLSKRAAKNLLIVAVSPNTAIRPIYAINKAMF